MERTKTRRGAVMRWLGGGVILTALAMTPLLMETGRSQPAAPALPDAERFIYSELADHALPSVVTIYVKNELSDEQKQQLRQFRRFFDRRQIDPRQIDPRQIDPRQKDPFRGFEMPGPGPAPDEGTEDEFENMPMPQRSGSGVIISEDGHIITNAHVIGEITEGSDIRVVFADDKEIQGEAVKLVDSNPVVDLAILKIDPSKLDFKPRPLRWGDSDKLRIGERIAAIGSPLDLRLTITHGIVSAKSRNIEEIAGLGDMIQTDAVINPGSSGGALINMDGELVGINRLITTTTGMWSGNGFAIPSNDARYFAEAVIREGTATYGFIGITMAQPGVDDTPRLRQALGLELDAKGVLVEGVSEPGPAAEAGLERYDFITHIDGERIDSNNELLRTIMRKRVGDRITVKVLRGGGEKPQEREMTLKIASRPSITELREQQEQRQEPADGDQGLIRGNAFLGMTLEPTGEGLRVTRVQPGSPAMEQGMEEGDVIMEINRQAVKSLEDVASAVENRADRGHFIKFLRAGREQVMILTR